MPAPTLTESQLGVFEWGRLLLKDAPSAADIAQVLASVGNAQERARIIGGMAVLHHGYECYTNDVDLLYLPKDAGILRRFAKDFELLHEAGNGWHRLRHRRTGVRLDLVPAGFTAEHGVVPSPYNFDDDNGFASLHGLVWTKLVSGRMQDEAAVIELYKRNRAVPAVCKQLSPELRVLLNARIARAKMEIANDPNNHPHSR